MKTMLKWILRCSTLVILSGCSFFTRGTASETPVFSPTQVATLAPTTVGISTPTLQPDAAATGAVVKALDLPPTSPAPQSQAQASTADTASLVSQVQQQFAAGTYEGVEVLPLAVQPGHPYEWAVYSRGMLNYDTQENPSHFLAIYTQNEGGAWEELAQVQYRAVANDAAPDDLDAGSVKQVEVDPSRIWLTVEGGLGAHSGVFLLLSFDGQHLKLEVQGASDSPAVGSLADLNDDGVPEVILNVSDYYVFCYACGVRKYAYQVYHWDASQQAMILTELSTATAGLPEAAASATQQAVALAKAGLWKDALVQADQALAAAPGHSDVAWNRAIIRLHAERLKQAVSEDPYPLLANVFYGDYAAAVDLMRAVPPQQIFTLQSPLIVGTPAENNVAALSGYLIDSSNAALQYNPNLAPAYVLRGWAEYLQDASSPQAKADITQALKWAPNDPFYQACAAALK